MLGSSLLVANTAHADTGDDKFSLGMGSVTVHPTSPSKGERHRYVMMMGFGAQWPLAPTWHRDGYGAGFTYFWRGAVLGERFSLGATAMILGMFPKSPKDITPTGTDLPRGVRLGVEFPKYYGVSIAATGDVFLVGTPRTGGVYALGGLGVAGDFTELWRTLRGRGFAMAGLGARTAHLWGSRLGVFAEVGPTFLLFNGPPLTSIGLSLGILGLF